MSLHVIIMSVLKQQKNEKKYDKNLNFKDTGSRIPSGKALM